MKSKDKTIFWDGYEINLLTIERTMAMIRFKKPERLFYDF